MRWLKRGVLAMVIAVLAVAAFTGWYVYGAWPVPDGYTFPRHSIWGSGPAALFEGTLLIEDGCIRTAEGTPATVVWPPGYRLAIEDGQPVVHGGDEPIRMELSIRMGGGWYESGSPPPTSFDIGNCPPPYFLSTGLARPER